MENYYYEETTRSVNAQNENRGNEMQRTCNERGEKWEKETGVPVFKDTRIGAKGGWSQVSHRYNSQISERLLSDDCVSEVSEHWLKTSKRETTDMNGKGLRRGVQALVAAVSLLAMVLNGVNALGQCAHTEKTVGTGNTQNNQYVPINVYYNYNYTQIIYTPDEICGANISGDIYGIAFRHYNRNITQKNNVEIYIGETDKDAFTSNTDWVTTGLTRVYSGNFNFTGEGWKWFQFDSPFRYSGYKNIVVAIWDKSGNCTGANDVRNFYYASCTGNKYMNFYDDDDQITSIAAPGQSADRRVSYRPQTKFCAECCNSSYSVPVCFDFEDATASNSYSTDSGLPLCWGRIYGGTTTGCAPHVYNGTAYARANDGNGIIMLAANNSTTYGNPNYVILPQVTGVAAGTTITFNAWWENTSYCTLTLGYMTNPGNPATFVAIGNATPVAAAGGSAATGINEFTVPAGFPSGAYIAFRISNTNGTWYTVTIDNICFKNCTEPTFTLSGGNLTCAMGGTCNGRTLTTNNTGTQTWASSATNVATVDGSGNITMVGAGTTTISVTVPEDNGLCGASASYQLTVTCQTPTFAITPNSGTLTIGNTRDLNTLLNNPTGGSVTWGTSAAGVASVTDGVIRAEGAGTATITATLASSGIYCGATATYTVTVNECDEEILLNGNITKDIECGRTYCFYDSGKDESYSNNEDYTATFTSGGLIKMRFLSFAGESGWDYISINGTTSDVTETSTIASNTTFTASVSGGTVTVTWHSDGSNVYAGWKAYITAEDCCSQNPDFSLSSSGSTMAVGSTVNLVPLLTNTPAAAVTWQSSNTGVAQVSNAGVVTAVGPGTAVITVRREKDGNWCPAVATYTVTVPCPTYTVPICFDFEDYGTPGNDISPDAGIPSCWDRIFTGSSSGYSPHVYNGTYEIDGNGIVLTSGSSTYGSDNYIILPVINGIAVGDTIKFNAWWESTNYGTLTLGYMTDPSNAATFTALGTATVTYYGDAGAADVVNEVILTSAIPAGARLAFRWSNTTSWYSVAIDNICISHPCTVRTSGSLTFVTPSQTIVVGQHSTQTPVNGLTPSNGTISYHSSSPSVATVNPSTGEVTGLAEGTTTITATLSGEIVNGVYYCPVTASYTIDVTACEYTNNTVGNGGSYNVTFGPVDDYYNYGYRQIIYDKSELCNGAIHSIGFQYAGASTMTAKTDVYVYMAETDKTEFDNNNDWVDDDDFTLVYSGALNCHNGWNWFALDNVFNYTGTKNLVVAIHDRSGSYNDNTYTFYYTAGTENKQIYYRNDNTDVSMATPPTATGTTANRPNTKFCIECCTGRTGTLTFGESYKSIIVGESYTQRVTNNLTPSNGNERYASSNPGVATVNPTTGAVTAVAPGIVTITGTIESWDNGSGTEYCAVTATYTVEVKCAEVAITSPNGCAEIVDGICMINACAPTSLTLGVESTMTPTSYTWVYNGYDNTGEHESHGSTLTMALNEQRGYDVRVTVSDGVCDATARARVRVSEGVVPTSNALPDIDLGHICVGTEGHITIGSGSGSDIQVDEPSVTVEAVLGQGVQTFIPDGPNCATKCYNSNVTFNDFSETATVTSADDIKYLRINMEHSYIVDLQIKLICPSNRSVIIFQDYYTTANGGLDDDTYTWPHTHISGGRNILEQVVLGTHNATDGTTTSTRCNPANNPAGIGEDYCWSNNTSDGYTYASGNGYIYEAANLNTIATQSYQVKPSDMTNMSQIYHPWEDFSGLIGCPLNGTWQVQVCDSWEEDNGWIFNWELKLSEDKLPTQWGFDVTLKDRSLDCGEDAVHTEQVGDILYIRPQWGDRATDCQLVLTDNFGCQTTLSNHINFVIDSAWINLKSGNPVQQFCEGSTMASPIVYAYGDIKYCRTEFKEYEYS